MTENVLETGSLTESPPATHYDHSQHSSSTLILILLLIMVIVLSVTVILYLFLRLRRLRQLLPSSIRIPSQATTSPFPVTASPTAPTPSGIQMQSLPSFTFSSVNPHSSASVDCPVCLSRFESQDLVRLLPLCCHTFHVECIDNWLQTNQTCPLCQSAIFATDLKILDILQSSSGGGEGRDNISQRGIALDVAEDPPDSSSTSRLSSVGSFEHFAEDDFEAPISHVSDDESIAIDSHVVVAQSEYEA